MFRVNRFAAATGAVWGVLVAAALVSGGACDDEKKAGPPPANGTSCAVVDNGNGTVTITCTDGTSATVSNGANGMNGMNGGNGSSCALVDNHDGTRTVDCGNDAGVFTIPVAVVDFTFLTARERAEAAMSAAISSVTIPADGRPLITLKVTERHGFGVKNLSPAAVTWLRRRPLCCHGSVLAAPSQ